MYQNQMNSLTHINQMHPMNINLSTNTNNQSQSQSFLKTLPIPTHFNTNSNGTHISAHTIDESPDSLRSQSNNSANNSTTTPTADASLFMPTIGAIDQTMHNTTPMTSPNIITAHQSFNNHTGFRFDAPSNMSGIQSMHTPMMQTMCNTTQMSQNLSFSPLFVRNAQSNTYAQYQNRSNVSYTQNAFPPQLQTQNNRSYNQSQHSQSPFSAHFDTIQNNNSFSNMPMLQSDNTSDSSSAFNQKNLNVNPAFPCINNDDSLRLLPPNIMQLNPINTLAPLNESQIMTNMSNMLLPTTHIGGPKTVNTNTNANTTRNIPQLRGAEKFGFMDGQPIITDIDHISKLNVPKVNKRKRRPQLKDSKIGIKAQRQIKKSRGRKKKSADEGIEFIESVEWSKAHRYHQYCPFCVRDERKKKKSEFWDKLPLRETLNKQERKAYDRECKQLLQGIEAKVKKQVVFESGIEYRKHYDTYHKKYGFKCIYSGCCKESSSWYNFVAHLTQHDRESGRPFYCAYVGCNRRSSTKHNLIKHLQGVHKWKIINKEEPKQCGKSSHSHAQNNHNKAVNDSIAKVNIKTESLTTASPSPAYLSSAMNMDNIRNNNMRWSGISDFDLKNMSAMGQENMSEDGSDLRKKYGSAVIQEPIIIRQGMNDNRYKGYKPQQYQYNNILCYNRVTKAHPMAYVNNNLMNQSNNVLSNTPTLMNNSTEQKVSNNDCIVSPHLLTAIDQFFKEEDNGKVM